LKLVKKFDNVLAMPGGARGGPPCRHLIRVGRKRERDRVKRRERERERERGWRRF
jgi:hypothetical protein